MSRLFTPIVDEVSFLLLSRLARVYRASIAVSHSYTSYTTVAYNTSAVILLDTAAEGPVCNLFFPQNSKSDREPRIVTPCEPCLDVSSQYRSCRDPGVLPCIPYTPPKDTPGHSLFLPFLPFFFFFSFPLSSSQLHLNLTLIFFLTSSSSSSTPRYSTFPSLLSLDSNTIPFFTSTQTQYQFIRPRSDWHQLNSQESNTVASTPESVYHWNHKVQDWIGSEIPLETTEY